MPLSFLVKRLYDEPDSDDGQRLLVDGLWPRGVRRSEWPDRSWRPGLAPTPELRRWYGHDPARFDEFARRYRAELATNPEINDVLALDGRVTLVTATRELDYSHAAVLRDFLEDEARL